jgi:hypothetical protein
LGEVFLDLHSKVKGVRLLLDPKSGLSEDIKVTYAAQDQ